MCLLSLKTNYILRHKHYYVRIRRFYTVFFTFVLISYFIYARSTRFCQKMCCYHFLKTPEPPSREALTCEQTQSVISATFVLLNCSFYCFIIFNLCFLKIAGNIFIVTFINPIFNNLNLFRIFGLTISPFYSIIYA